MSELVMPRAGHAGGRPARRIADRARGVVTALRERVAIRRTVAKLQSLDDRTLTDIGLHRSEIPSLAWGIGGDRIRHRQQG